MLKVLLKKQFAEIFRSYFYNGKKNCARSKAATAAYIVLFAVLMIAVVGGIFTGLSWKICSVIVRAGMDWFYFALMGLTAILLGTFGSVFNTYSGLYLAKDNDLLLSMPIPVRAIIASRLLGVYLMGLMYSGVVMIPAVIVYFIYAPLRVSAVCGSVLLIFLMSVIVLILSCTLGWVVAKVSLKLKHKSLITVILSLAFFAAYYFFYFKAQELLSMLLANIAVYGERVRGSAYFIYLFGAAGAGSWGAMAAVTAAVLVLAGLMWLVLSRSFLTLAIATGRTERKRSSQREAVQKSPEYALLRKEFGRFFSSPSYILNCGFGIFLLPIAGLFLLIKGRTFFQTVEMFLGGWKDFIPVALAAAVCLLASMNDMAEPSVSLEGKNLWIAQSLPVTPWQVLRAKLAVQLILTAIPAAVCLVCVFIAYPAGLWTMALEAAISLSFVLLSALVDMMLGLKLPNLHWTNEITPIKQTAGVAIALFGGWLYPIALVALYFLFGNRLGFPLYGALFFLLTIALCTVLFLWLKRKGCARFASL